jgi:hypothetical protein
VTIPFSALQALESFYEKFDPDFIDIRTKAREVLQREDDLNEIVQVDFAHIFFHLLAIKTMMFQPFFLYYVASAFSGRQHGND